MPALGGPGSCTTTFDRLRLVQCASLIAPYNRSASPPENYTATGALIAGWH